MSNEGKFNKKPQSFWELVRSDLPTPRQSLQLNFGVSLPVSARRTNRRWESSANAEFRSTQWSLVLAAGQSDTSQSQIALEELCRRYWLPLYAYARRRLRDVHEAQDAVQSFFSSLLERKAISLAEPERGRFRSFLLTSFRRFLANEHERRSAQKRGGGSTPLPLDFAMGESRCLLEPMDELTAERLYERQWVIALLERVFDQLRQAMTQMGRENQFEMLAPFLAGANRDISYAEAARRLGLSEGAAMVAAHRLRTRYRQMLHAEIAQTLGDPDEVAEEIGRLFTCFDD